MPSIEHPSEVKVFSADVFVLDTNILLLTQAASITSIERGGREYSALLEGIRARNAKVMTAPEVIGEYVNRRFARAYDIASQDPALAERFAETRHHKDSLREFRKMPEFAELIEEVRTEVEGIFGWCKVERSGVGTKSLTLTAIDMVRDANLDLTDAVLVALAREHDAPIITHDRDFARSQQDVALISALSVT